MSDFDKESVAQASAAEHDVRDGARAEEPRPRPAEVGGPPGPEPTRYGDWERKGRCIDF